MQFDISNIPSRGGPIQHASIRNQYNTLFRNLQSFSSCALHDNDYDRGHDFDRTQNSNQHVPVDPDKRYFTFRVEFQNETFCTPQALDPSHRVNRHAATAAPAAAQKEDGTGYTRTSLVCQGMKSMVATTLGQVVERNCIGLGVKLVAYNHFGEVEEYDEGDGDVNGDVNEDLNEDGDVAADIRDTTVPGTKDDDLSVHRPKRLKRNNEEPVVELHPDLNPESQSQEPVSPIIANETSAFAIPFRPKSDKTLLQKMRRCTGAPILTTYPFIL